MGRAHAAALRVLGQAVSEVHAPADVQGAARGRPAGRRPRASRRCSTRWRSRTTPISTSSAAASIRWRRAASSARCSRSFRRASRTARRRATTSPACCGAFAGYPVAVELRHRSWSDRDRRDARAAERVRRRLGADRRAEVPLLDPPELPAERPRLLLHAPARPERRAVVAAREVGGSLRLSVLGRRAEGVHRNGGRGAGGS